MMVEDDTFVFYTEYTNAHTSVREISFLSLFQKGLMFSALMTGLFCIIHILAYRTSKCRNEGILLLCIITGFIHMLMCVYLLEMSVKSARDQIPRGGHQQCLDYSLPATWASAVVFLNICVNMIRHNFKNTFTKCILTTLTTASILIGCYLLMNKNLYLLGSNFHQDVFLSLGNESPGAHVAIFWSVCLRDIQAEKTFIIVEYVFIYCPVLLIILTTLVSAAVKRKDGSSFKILILDEDCSYNINTLSQSCVCSKLNTAFNAVLVYFVAIIFIVRPALIAWGHMTSGSFRDVLPNLLHTVIFCFICSEYIISIYRSHFNENRKMRPFNQKILQV